MDDASIAFLQRGHSRPESVLALSVGLIALGVVVSYRAVRATWKLVR